MDLDTNMQPEVQNSRLKGQLSKTWPNGRCTCESVQNTGNFMPKLQFVVKYWLNSIFKLCTLLLRKNVTKNCDFSSLKHQNLELKTPVPKKRISARRKFVARKDWSPVKPLSASEPRYLVGMGHGKIYKTWMKIKMIVKLSFILPNCHW